MQVSYGNLKLDYRQFIMSSQEMFCVLDLRGNILEANDAFMLKLGYTLDDLRNKPLYELFHPNDQKSFSQLYQQGCYETRVFSGDGTYKVLSWSVVPIVEAELLFAMVHDITQQKKQEQTAQREIRQAYALLDDSPDAVFTLDKEGCITYLNKRAEEVSLAGKREIKGKKIWDVIPQTINSVLYKDYRRIMAEQKELSFETFHPTRNEWFELKVRPAADGVSLYYHDITQRKLAEGFLRIKEHVFNDMPSLMAVENYADKKIVEVNSSFLNTLGYHREDLIGKSLTELGILAEDAAQEIEILKEKGLIRNKEINLRTKAGERRSGLLSAEALAIGDNQYLLLEFIDLTEKIKNEEEQNRLKRLEIASQIVAGIAHEIRNPMTTISGLLQMIAGKTEANKEYVDMIMAEFNRINYTIEDFLSFGRSVSDNMKVQNLSAIIQDIYPLLKAYALESGKEIEMYLEDVPDIPLDGSEIKTLVLHLVRNGLEAIEGQGKVTLETHLEGDSIVLAVRDTGCGIEEQVRDKIGMPFFTTKSKAAGLGLAKCYSIASRHAANIKIDTGPQGTVVNVAFRTGE